MAGNGTSKELFITRFDYQHLLGYQCDRSGRFRAKIYEAKVVLSDGSTRLIYGIQKDNTDVVWDWQSTSTKPEIHRDNFGIWRVDPNGLPE